MPENKDKTEDPMKAAKKLFQAYSEVLSHKLGRSPNLDEVVAAIKVGTVEPSPANPNQAVETLKKQPVTSPGASGVGAIATPPMEKAVEPNAQPVQPMIQTQQPQQIDPSSPKIFSLKILYGLKDDDQGNKSPDPQTPLFYSDGESRHFDCSNDSWIPQLPDIAQHLMQRPLMHDSNNQDAFDALLHGVIDDGDYASLDQAGMIDDRCKKLKNLLGQLDQQYSEYDSFGDAGDTVGLEPVHKTDDDIHQEPHESQIQQSVEDSAADPVNPDGRDSGDDISESSKIDQPDMSRNSFAELVSCAFGEGIDPRTKQALQKYIREEIQILLKEGLPQ